MTRACTMANPKVQDYMPFGLVDRVKEMAFSRAGRYRVALEMAMKEEKRDDN
jgi:hypothetical protein